MACRRARLCCNLPPSPRAPLLTTPLVAVPQVVRGEPRNPLNQAEALMKVLDGSAAVATIQ